MLELMNSNKNSGECEIYQAYDKCLDAICSNREKYVNDPSRDFVRSRKLPMNRLMELVISAGSESTKNTIDDFIDGLTTRTGCSLTVPSQAAFTKQRRKLKPEAFEDLFRLFNSELGNIQGLSLSGEPASDGSSVRRIAIDGTDLYYESGPAYSDPKYHRSGAGRGYYEQCVTALYDITADSYLDALISGVHNASEPADMCVLVDRMKPGSGEQLLYTADRAYCTYNCLAHLQESGAWFVVRGKDIDSNGIAAGLGLPDEAFDKRIQIRIGRSLPVDSVLPEGLYYRNIGPNQRFDYLGQRIFGTYTLNLRVVRFRLSTGEWELIFTNLPDTFSAQDVKAEYARRWGEEVAFRDLKYTIGAVSFHARIDYLVTQEIWARLILFNICAASAALSMRLQAERDAEEAARAEAKRSSSEAEGVNTDDAEKSRNREPFTDFIVDFNDAAHVVRRNLISRALTWREMARRITRYRERIVPDRHEPRHMRPRRRFYLVYRAA